MAITKSFVIFVRNFFVSSNYRSCMSKLLGDKEKLMVWFTETSNRASMVITPLDALTTRLGTIHVCMDSTYRI